MMYYKTAEEKEQKKKKTVSSERFRQVENIVKPKYILSHFWTPLLRYRLV